MSTSCRFLCSLCVRTLLTTPLRINTELSKQPGTAHIVTYELHAINNKIIIIFHKVDVSGDLLGRDPLCKRLFAFRVVVYRRFDCLPFTGFVLIKGMLSYSFQGCIQSLDTFVRTFPTICAISLTLVSGFYHYG